MCCARTRGCQPLAAPQAVPRILKIASLSATKPDMAVVSSHARARQRADGLVALRSSLCLLGLPELLHSDTSLLPEILHTMLKKKKYYTLTKKKKYYTLTDRVVTDTHTRTRTRWSWSTS
jgi:hypothetical protein